MSTTHTFRTLRSLALLGAGSLVACGGQTTAVVDAGSDALSTSDASSADVATLPDGVTAEAPPGGGVCINGYTSGSIGCAGGSTCSWEFGKPSNLACAVITAEAGPACGTIFCAGPSCACDSPGVCKCNGPLPGGPARTA